MRVNITDTPTAIPGLTDGANYMFQNQTRSRRLVYVVAASAAPDADDAAEFLAFGDRWWGRKDAAEEIYVWGPDGGQGFITETT